MKSFPRLVAVLLLVLFGLAGSAAAETNSSEAFYIPAKDLPAQLLPPPPPANSKAATEGIMGVIAAQQHISKDDLKELRDEQHLRIEIITRVLGPSFTRDHLPKTYMMLDHIFADASAISDADKQFWHTKRPYLVDQRVKLLVDPLDKSPAYPSGHTATSYVIAEVLGLLFPGHQNDLRLRAHDIAYHRVEAGVHYLYDIEAGRLLAMQIIGALMESDDFQIDFLAARDEIARLM